MQLCRISFLVETGGAWTCSDLSWSNWCLSLLGVWVSIWWEAGAEEFLAELLLMEMRTRAKRREM